MGSRDRKRQLKRMYHRQRGHCVWCGRKMLPPGSHNGKGTPPPLLCTYDHLDCRYSEDRGKHPGEFRNVAACWECNNNRAAMQQANVPKSVLWAKSGSYPTSPETPC